MLMLTALYKKMLRSFTTINRIMNMRTSFYDRIDFPYRVGYKYAALLLMIALLLSGCGSSAGVVQTESTGAVSAYSENTGTYFDTVISVRIYGDQADSLLREVFDFCEEMENTLSAQLETSELYLVNHRESNRLTISDDLAECIRLGLRYSAISDGAFCISILPVRELWDFSNEDHSASVPDETKILEALQKVDDSKIHLEGNTLTFDSDDTQIDLGGIAKGYISGRIKELLRENGCTSALINLGGNVSTLGVKPDGEAFSVGIQKPFADRGEIMTVVSSADNCVISSGTYERYFTVDDQIYHHILDPETGYPADTELTQVTVIGTDDAMCDALATVGIIVGEEKMISMIEENQLDVRVLFTGADGTMDWYPE